MPPVDFETRRAVLSERCHSAATKSCGQWESPGIAVNIQQDPSRALQDAAATRYESWFPRVSEANHLKFLDKVDDVKDHQPARTIDIITSRYRELFYPLGQSAARVLREKRVRQGPSKVDVAL
jgi:hypothetical protein